jgi:hypothetical protein
MPRVSRRLVYKARPHASNIPVSLCVLAELPLSFC